MKNPEALVTETINGIEWHLRDSALIETLGPFAHEGGERRRYGVYPFKTGKIFVKSFLEEGLIGILRNRINPRGRIEYLLSEKLASLSISTPRTYGYGLGPRNSSVVHEYMTGESFIDLFRRSVERTPLIIALAELLKTLKQKHVRHNDLHLNNVLVSDNRLYLIDLHKTRIKRSFTTDDEISNLSHALAMAYRIMSPAEKETFFHHYGQAGIQPEVEKTLKTMHTRWIHRKQQRAFDNTSKTRWRGRHLYVAGMEDRGQGDFVETIKKDKKVTVERFTDHVRKTYASKRRLKRAWKAHVALVYLNLPVIPETFCLKMPPPLQRGYICMEDLGGKGEEFDRHVDRVYDTASSRERKALADAFAGFLQETLRIGVIHRDMKGCNIFRLNDGTFRFLDLEDVTFRETDRNVLEKMLVQLNTTLPKRIAFKNRLRFLIRLTTSLGLDKKLIFRNVARESSGKEIVYQGVGGLKRELW